MTVYFDHNSTTQIAEPVLDAMMPFLKGEFGNASSRHDFGTRSREAVNVAREQVASLLDVQASQVIFTSGGTESNNMFINGLASYGPPRKIFISAIEHPCVMSPAGSLRKSGWSLEILPVTKDGAVMVEEIKANAFERNCLVSVMLANNETGVLQAVKELAANVRRAGGWIHTDAIQAIGKIPVSFSDLGVHAMSVSAHKLNGPKGVGALIVDKKLPIDAFIKGGGHEFGLRSGTENVASIVGFGVAATLVSGRLETYQSRIGKLRETLERRLAMFGAVIHGQKSPRLSNTCYFSLPGIQGETLVMELNKAGFALASGSACSSHSSEISPTLKAMGISEELAYGAVRLSLGLDNTVEECDAFITSLEKIVLRLNNLVSLTV